MTCLQPTGFGKSMIFTIFLLAKQELEKGLSNDIRIVVFSPLTSIITDQIADMGSIRLKAVQLGDKFLDEIVQYRSKFIYCSAETATSSYVIPSGFTN